MRVLPSRASDKIRRAPVESLSGQGHGMSRAGELLLNYSNCKHKEDRQSRRRQSLPAIFAALD